jgi:hypothetical protein
VPAISATYRLFGDTGPWQFHNGFDVTAGASYVLTSRTTALLTYEYVEASDRLISDSHEILAGLSPPPHRSQAASLGLCIEGTFPGRLQCFGRCILVLHALTIGPSSVGSCAPGSSIPKG